LSPEFWYLGNNGTSITFQHNSNLSTKEKNEPANDSHNVV
jgi:hypothetical protein